MPKAIPNTMLIQRTAKQASVAPSLPQPIMANAKLQLKRTLALQLTYALDGVSF